MFGDDYPTPDGTGVRDYIHVCDLASGHLKALEKLESIHGAEAYNLGTGHGSSVLEVVHAFEKACGHPVNYKIAPRRPGDIAECYADVSKAKKELGWEATRTIDDMCRDSWNFIVKETEREKAAPKDNNSILPTRIETGRRQRLPCFLFFGRRGRETAMKQPCLTKVFFEGSFYGHHGRDHAGREIRLGRAFDWAGTR